MSKAVAVHAIVLVIIIAMFAIVAILSFTGYLKIQNVEVGKATCISKFIKFCTEWFREDTAFISEKKPGWWSSQEPTNCDQFNVKEPSPEECKLQVK